MKSIEKNGCNHFKVKESDGYCMVCREKGQLYLQVIEQIDEAAYQDKVIALAILQNAMTNWTHTPVSQTETHDCKKCNRCGLYYDLTAFRKDHSMQDGLTTICTNCIRIRRKLFGNAGESSRGRIGELRFIQLYLKYGPICPDCGVVMDNFLSDTTMTSTTDVTVDHILAYSFWKADDMQNLRLVCRGCNSRKSSDLDMDLFLKYGLLAYPPVQSILDELSGLLHTDCQSVGTLASQKASSQ